jgi:5-oxoprolinase (ATP-hydrolysing)
VKSRAARIAFDIGGTFTDVVLLDDRSGAISMHKVLTTPSEPARGSLEGIRELLGGSEVSPSHLSLAVHGTTLVTNAVIERKGARVGLITTRGFRDAIEIGREQRYDIDDLFITFPEPLVPRMRRLEISERTSRDGDELRPVHTFELEAIASTFEQQGVESIAVVLLHSYANPTHELIVEEYLAQRLPGVPVSVSSDVAPEIREYERSVTTVANAYVVPLIARYLRALETSLAEDGYEGPLLLMQSNGGTTSPAAAARRPITLLESGPAGGATFAADLGRRIGIPDLIAFDMGGTTAKVCLIRDHRPDIAAQLEAGREHRFKQGSGLPIRTPVIDMIEIGAGGGSIARRTPLGLLEVGPDSAGADPGPACYGRGGTAPTVTDANLLLGYLDPSYFLGGRLALDVEAAEQAVVSLGASLGLDLTATAMGIHELVSENMAAAARIHIVEKGVDPRDFCLVAFGGAAPAHASGVARLLGVSEVIIPRAAGAASALGFLVAPLTFDLTRSFPGPLSRVSLDDLAAMLKRMESDGRALLLESDHVGDVSVEVVVEMRILGQVHQIQVRAPEGAVDEAWRAQLTRAFHETYRRTYEHLPPVEDLEVINWRTRVSAHQPQIRFDDAQPISEDLAKGSRPACFDAHSGYIDVRVFDRYALPEGFAASGPAIIEEREATTIVWPTDAFRVDEHGNLRIDIGGLS